MYANILEPIGDCGPYIMILYSIGLLFSKPNMLFYFIVGICLSFIVNNILKGIIKQPRPEFNTKEVSIALQTSAVRYILGYDIYGMPSGHAQHCGFILVFVTLVLNSPLVTGTFSVLSLICLYQRYLYQNHTLLQVIVGFVVGLGVGYLFYELGTKKLVGNVKMRPDDDGPL